LRSPLAYQNHYHHLYARYLELYTWNKPSSSHKPRYYKF